MDENEIQGRDLEAAKLAQEVVSRTRLMVATPSGNGEHVAAYTVAMVGTQAMMGALGGGMVYFSLSNESFLIRARNKILSGFLETTCTHLLMVDADMAWDPRSVVRMLAHEEDFVAANYLRKERQPARWTAKFIEPVTVDGRGLMKAQAVGMGFCLVSRACIERMVKECDAPTYRDNEDGKLTHALFDRDFANGMFRSEDVTFCHRWTDIGGTVYVDPWIELEHIGQFSWKGRFSDAIRPVVQDHDDTSKIAAE